MALQAHSNQTTQVTSSSADQSQIAENEAQSESEALNLATHFPLASAGENTGNKKSQQIQRQLRLAPRKPSPQVILQLQRTIGNQAVRRLISNSKTQTNPRPPSAPAPTAVERSALAPAPVPVSTNQTVVQRYSVINDTQKLSTAQTSLLVDKHSFYATQALVNAANQKLNAAGGGQDGKAGAFLRLLADTTQAHPNYQNLVKVFPTVCKRESDSPKNQSPRKNFLEQNEVNNKVKYLSPADCHIAAQTVMGSEDFPSGVQDNEKAVIKGDDGNAKQLTSATGDQFGGKHLANRAKHSFFEDAMPRFATLLENTDNYNANNPYKEIVNLISTAKNLASRAAGANNEYARIYRDKILTNGEVYKLFTKTFGINEDAIPEVGQAFSNINDEFQKDTLEKGDNPRDIWNFHWAGVVMVDGKDYVTLENLSVEDTNALNENWYFQMYGAGEQSFHTEALKDSHATPAAITLGFTTVGQANHPQPKQFNPSTAQKMLLGWFVKTKNEQKTLQNMIDEIKELGINTLKDPEQTLKGIWKNLGFNAAEVTPEAFIQIKDMLNGLITELPLLTQEPKRPALPPPINIPVPMPIPQVNNPAPIPQVNNPAPIPQVNNQVPIPMGNNQDEIK